MVDAKTKRPALHWLSAGRKRKRLAILSTALGFTATLLAAPPKPSTRTVPSTSLPRPAKTWFQIGKASWYGRQFQGKRTATGESFDMNAFTCAHRTLPLGSWLRVTNLRNHKSTLVRVNDRGPGPRNLMLDLSFAAARTLGIGGLASVRIEQVNPAQVNPADLPTAQALLSGLPSLRPTAPILAR